MVHGLLSRQSTNYSTTEAALTATEWHRVSGSARRRVEAYPRLIDLTEAVIGGLMDVVEGLEYLDRAG